MAVKDTSPQNLHKGFDIDKLAKAVAMHETKDCTVGNSASQNNCFGIRECHYGHCHGFKEYTSQEASYYDFKRIWSGSYKTFPTLKMARKYSGWDRADDWLKNVTYFYNTI